MRISNGMRERFNAAGLFTASQLAVATGLTPQTVVERSRDPRVKRQKVGKLTFIDVRTFALTLDEAPVLKMAALSLLKKVNPTASVVSK